MAWRYSGMTSVSRALDYRRVFPKMSAKHAREMRAFVERAGLPMVNSGGRVDINLMALSGATHGIFVDQRYMVYYAQEVLSSCSDVGNLRVGRDQDQLYGRRISRCTINFTAEGRENRIDFYHADALDMDSILGDQRISLYYNAVQCGPDRIPDSGFDNLVEGGFMLTPYKLGDDDLCLKLTGLKYLESVNFDEIGHIREPFDSYFYRKVKTVPPVGSTNPRPGLLVFCYLTGMR